MRLDGYDGRFGLKCWRGPGRTGGPDILASDDEAALRAEAARRIASGEYALIEVAAWNFELNDWVRLEFVGDG